MTEDLSEIAEKPKPSTCKEAYLHLLGIDSGPVPEIGSFPEIVILPPEMIPGFFTAIDETNKDRRERGAIVGWDKSKKEPRSSAIKIGSEDKINMITIPQLLGLGNKQLIIWHTHPPLTNPNYTAMLSSYDVSSTINSQRHAFIDGIGSKDGGMFSFQSNTAGKTPFSSTLKARVAKATYRDMFDMPMYAPIITPLLREKLNAEDRGDLLGAKKALEAIHLKDHQIVGEVLREFGYETYVWLPEDNLERTQLFLRRLDTIPSQTG